MAPTPEDIEASASEPVKSVMSRLEDWGKSLLILIPSHLFQGEMTDNPPAASMPPAILASLITALHYRPFQPLPLFVFAPTLFFSSYLNLSGFTTGAAGISAAWSGLYVLLALRRGQGLRGKFSTRGLVRGGAVGLGGVNCVAGGWAYFKGDFERDERERVERNRWGN